MSKSGVKLFYIIMIPFWVAVYIVGIKFAIKWDNKKYLEAQDKYGYVNDVSPEAYYQ